MAKAFYSMEEVCELLGKSQEEIRELVRAGTLREFRDAGKTFFKAEDVSKLGGGAAGGAGADEVTLEPADEQLPMVADVEGSSFIGLEPVEEEKPGGLEAESVIASSGIGVFDDDELEIDADPMAETQITAGPSEDQVSLEGTGSGSGLLDLTREADDTSLGAELLDEIYPGEEEAAEAETVTAVEEPPAEREEVVEARVEPVAVVEAPAPLRVVAGDPTEGLFSGLMVGGLIVLAVAGSVVAGLLQGYLPDYARFLSDHFLYFLIGAVVLPLLALVVGWLIGKATAPRQA